MRWSKNEIEERNKIEFFHNFNLAPSHYSYTGTNDDSDDRVNAPLGARSCKNVVF